MNSLISESKGQLSLQLSGEEFLDSKNSCIYGWKRKDFWLYIGASSLGFSRVFTETHHILKRYTIEKDDIIYIWTFPFYSEKEIFRLETKIIKKLNPILNGSKKDIRFYSGLVKREKSILDPLAFQPEKIHIYNKKYKQCLCSANLKRQKNNATTSAMLHLVTCKSAYEYTMRAWEHPLKDSKALFRANFKCSSVH